MVVAGGALLLVFAFYWRTIIFLTMVLLYTAWQRTESSSRSGRARDVRLREIVALVEKRSAADLGLSVDETVPKVEPRRMSSSLAVASKGFERDMGGFRLDWLNDDPAALRKSPTCASASATDHCRFRDKPSTAS